MSASGVMAFSTLFVVGQVSLMSEQEILQLDLKPAAALPTPSTLALIIIGATVNSEFFLAPHRTRDPADAAAALVSVGLNDYKIWLGL